jgi:hypothetical protein
MKPKIRRMTPLAILVRLVSVSQRRGRPQCGQVNALLLMIASQSGQGDSFGDGDWTSTGPIFWSPDERKEIGTVGNTRWDGHLSTGICSESTKPFILRRPFLRAQDAAGEIDNESANLNGRDWGFFRRFRKKLKIEPRSIAVLCTGR